MAPFDPSQFYQGALEANGIEAFFGVPDSSLSGLLSFLAATRQEPMHIVMANEGGAIGLAAGYFLARRRVAMCYLQNSGYSNALNPLQSLAVKEVFGIPMLLMIGWRGMPGIKDEPQHALIGPRLKENLQANDIPFEIVPDSIEEAKDAIGRLIATAVEKSTPVALIVPPGAFTPYTAESSLAPSPNKGLPHVNVENWLNEGIELKLSREDVVRNVVSHIGDRDVSITSLGGSSREFYMVRKEKNEPLNSNFFCIGGMGHAFSLANGVRIATAEASNVERVICLDGDGSFLMHIGNNAVLADISLRRLVHVVVFNGVHSSTGNQPLTISKSAFLSLAGSLNYRQKFFVDSQAGLEKAWDSFDGHSCLIVVITNEAVSKTLPRPSETAAELKELFMKPSA